MITLRAPAKLNLDLLVGRPREDGFHPLSSWFVTVGIYDDLSFQRHPAPGIHLTCTEDTLPADATNLVWRAARGLLDSFPDHDPIRNNGLSIHLAKRIAIGSGLGGGSSDAATTLMGVDQLLDLRLPLEHLVGLGAGLGSDVAFFLGTPSALCTGRGEIVDSIPKPTAKIALVILPGMHCSTPAVYKEFDKQGLGSVLRTRMLATEYYKTLAKLPALELLPQLRNDLEAPAFTLHPELSALRTTLEATLGRPVRMSGSGSALFTLYDTREEGNAAQAMLSGQLAKGIKSIVADVGTR